MGITFIACHEFHSLAVDAVASKERERERILNNIQSILSDSGELFTWGKAGPHLGYELPENVTKQFRPKRVDALAEHKIINVSCGESHTLGTHRELMTSYHTKWHLFIQLALRVVRCLSLVETSMENWILDTAQPRQSPFPHLSTAYQVL